MRVNSSPHILIWLFIARTSSRDNSWFLSAPTIIFLYYPEEKFNQKVREAHNSSTRENAGSGHLTYVEICEDLNITPIRRILDQFRLTEMRLVHVGMNVSDCKALACALWVSTGLWNNVIKREPFKWALSSSFFSLFFLQYSTLCYTQAHLLIANNKQVCIIYTT